MPLLELLREEVLSFDDMTFDSLVTLQGELRKYLPWLKHGAERRQALHCGKAPL